MLYVKYFLLSSSPYISSSVFRSKQEVQNYVHATFIWLMNCCLCQYFSTKIRHTIAQNIEINLWRYRQQNSNRIRRENKNQRVPMCQKSMRSWCTAHSVICHYNSCLHWLYTAVQCLYVCVQDQERLHNGDSVQHTNLFGFLQKGQVRKTMIRKNNYNSTLKMRKYTQIVACKLLKFPFICAINHVQILQFNVERGADTAHGTCNTKTLPI